MLQAIEILCTNEELNLIDGWVDVQEHCTIEPSVTLGKDGALHVYRMQSFWLSLSNNSHPADAVAAERNRWAQFVKAFHAQFGY